MKSLVSLAVLLLFLSSLSIFAHADGLSTTFADVEIGLVGSGRQRRIFDAQGHGLRVKNLGATPVRVVIEVLVPQTSQLRPGAEPIPDIRWIHVDPAVLELGGHEEKESSLQLLVPPKKAYRGHYYQAMIWSHGAPSATQGVTISAGLLSKIRFRTKK